jgi:hypothetical protein
MRSVRVLYIKISSSRKETRKDVFKLVKFHNGIQISQSASLPLLWTIPKLFFLSTKWNYFGSKRETSIRKGRKNQSRN